MPVSADSKFSQTREHHQRELAEDYTELIAELETEHGEARIGTLASRLGVSHVSVVRAVRRLERDGLLVVSPRRGLDLTAKGRRLAVRSKLRHELVVEFLKALGVPTRTAEVDAEGAEHHFSPATLRAMRKFMEKAGN